MLLDGRVDVFVALAQELAIALAQAGVECVAGDAVEGFNPAHDVCRLIVDGAVDDPPPADGTRGAQLRFPAGWPARGGRPGSIVVRLDEAALERKLEAARDYTEMREK